jgi:predicted N-acetyltransferase YhbS
MADMQLRQQQVAVAQTQLPLPDGIVIRPWHETDFAAVVALSTAQGWTTPQTRPDAALSAWRNSWPSLVACADAEVVGFLRAMGDGHVSTYVAEVLVAPKWQQRGIGNALITVCHHLCPATRLDLLSTENAHAFYERLGFRSFQGFRKSHL